MAHNVYTRCTHWRRTGQEHSSNESKNTENACDNEESPLASVKEVLVEIGDPQGNDEHILLKVDHARGQKARNNVVQNGAI